MSIVGFIHILLTKKIDTTLEFHRVLIPFDTGKDAGVTGQ